MVGALLMLPTLSAAFPFALGAAPPTVTLKVASLLQAVPADGKSHAVMVVSLLGQAQQPSAASSPVTVFLSSSDVGVATVPQSVVIQARSDFVLFNITTTGQAGSTTISASAQGLKSGSVTATTKLPTGFPTQIQGYSDPSQTIPETSFNGTIVVELLDNSGNPAEARNDTTITVTSSSPGVANATAHTLVIPEGETLAELNYTSGLRAGSTTFSLSSPGLTGGAAKLTVTGSTPTQLKIQSASNPALPNSAQTLVIWLLDSSGDPTVAPAPIYVSLTTANTTLIGLPSVQLIPAGSSYVDVEYQTYGLPVVLGVRQTTAKAEVTAAVSGLVSAETTVTISKPTSPTNIGLGFIPSSVLANGNYSTSLFVSLLSGTNPANTTADTTISLTSSDPAVVNVSSSVTIYGGGSYAVADLYTSYTAGTAQITAAANDLPSAVITVKSFGETPASISVAAGPAKVPANGGTYPALDIQLDSADGKPAPAPGYTILNLFSSNPAVAVVNSTVAVLVGQTAVLVPVSTTLLPGTATISVSGSGLTSGSVSLTTVTPGAAAVKLSYAPEPAFLFAESGLASVQLIDSSGNLVQSGVPVEVTVTAGNDTILRAPYSVTVPAGANFVTFPLNITASGSTTLSATSQGLAPSTFQADFVAAPLKATIVVSPSPLAGTGSTATVRVTFNGAPLANASIRWAVSSGNVTPSSGMTGSDGAASATFTPYSKGVDLITATVDSPGLAQVKASLRVSVSSSSGQSFGLEDLALGFGAVLAVGGAVLLFFLMRRPTRRPALRT